MPDEGKGDGSCSINMPDTAEQLFEMTDEDLPVPTQCSAWRELYKRHHVDVVYGDVYDEDGKCLSTLRGQFIGR